MCRLSAWSHDVAERPRALRIGRSVQQRANAQRLPKHRRRYNARSFVSAVYLRRSHRGSRRRSRRWNRQPEWRGLRHDRRQHRSKRCGHVQRTTRQPVAGFCSTSEIDCLEARWSRKADQLHLVGHLEPRTGDLPHQGWKLARTGRRYGSVLAVSGIAPRAHGLPATHRAGLQRIRRFGGPVGVAQCAIFRPAVTPT